MVLKPSPYTPLTVLALGELFRPVFPPGGLNVVTGPEPLGRRVIAHPVPAKIAFTGSTATGRRVGAAAITDLKRVTLELGGNDAAIVLDDAEPERFAESLFWGAMRNNGQLCLAIKLVEGRRPCFATGQGRGSCWTSRGELSTSSAQALCSARAHEAETRPVSIPRRASASLVA
jgi:Aldehyde dehydrogenase family